MKKKYPAVVVFLLLLSVACAQDNKLQLYALKGISFNDPVLIGKAGENYVLIDQPGSEGTPLYVLNSSYQLLKQTLVPSAAYTGYSNSSAGNVNMLWLDKKTSQLNLLRINETGNEEPLKQYAIPADLNPAWGRLISDKDHQYYLFFSLFTDTLQHVFLKGILFDASLNKIKTLFHSFDVDVSLERVAGPLLDAAGDLHLVMYDKLTNYRESGTVRINTMPLKEEEVLTESFQFDKVKFYDMVLFDNTADQKIQLAGFYYDGNSKSKKGLASIQFPYTRTNQVIPKFNLISEQQKSYLANGMQHLRKHTDIMDYLKVKDIIEEDGHVFVSAWILDIPGNLVVKDNEREDYNNTDVAYWVRIGREGTGDYLNSPGSNIPAPIDALYSTVTYTYPINNATQIGVREYRTEKQLRKPVTISDKRNREKNTLKLPEVHPEKIVFFSMDKKGNQKWLQLVPGNFPVHSAGYSDSLLDYPLIENGQLYFAHYPVTTKENKTHPGFSVISVNELGATGKTISFDMPSAYRFFKPIKLSGGKYLSAYTNKQTQQSGLAVLEVNTQ